MPGPIDSLRYVHTAIEVEAARLETRALEASSPADASALAEDLAWLGELIGYHTRGEEAGLFPPLAEKLPHVHDTYLFDHVEERELLARLEKNCAACSGSNGEAALAELKRDAVALNAHAKSHIHKENDLILPLVHEHFPPPDQAKMIQAILATIPPEKMAKAVPWIVERQGPEEAAAYVRVLMHAMPEPVFAQAKTWIRAGIDAQRWADLTNRIPALA